MKRPPLALALAALLAAVALAAVAPGAARANGCPTPWAGAGTAESPYLVSTAWELNAVRRCYYHDDYHWRQTADIDLSAAYRPWAPIEDFQGVYDGGGHRISGLLVDDVSAPGAPKGLFMSTNGARISRIELVAPRIEGRVSGYGTLVGYAVGGALTDITIRDAELVATYDYQSQFGGVAGWLDGTEVRRVLVDGLAVSLATGVEDAPDRVGGIAGYASGSLIADATVRRANLRGRTVVGGIAGDALCSRVEAGVVAADVTVRADESIAGGAVGVFRGLCNVALGVDPAVVDVSAAATVSGGEGVGGLIGQAVDATLTRTAAYGTATAPAGEAGGLIGRVATATITDSYALGAVTASGPAGGLVGAVSSRRADELTIARAYAAGRVSAGPGEAAGGLLSGATLNCIDEGVISLCSVDSAATAVTASFWDAEATGQSTSSDGGAARSSAQMRELATFTAADWSIAAGRGGTPVTVWGICTGANGGRPFLQWQAATATGACAAPSASPPTAPRNLRVVVGDGRLTISWDPPASDGGSPITGYTATAQMQERSGRTLPSCTTVAPTTTCTITGLRNGRAYRVSVTASNGVGVGTAAAAASPVRPRDGMAVVSTRRAGGTVVTRVRVTGPGRITQVGRLAGTGAVACRVTSRPARAGVVVLRCALPALALRTLADGPLAVRLVTRFAATGGGTATATRTVVFARTAPAPPVTG